MSHPSDLHLECSEEEHKLHSEIDRLTAELAQAQEQLREAVDQGVRFVQRYESAEVNNRELAAQVAVMVERIKEAQLRLPDQLDDIHELLCKALTNLPAEAEKLVRHLVEAVGKLLHPPINSAIYMVVKWNRRGLWA